MTITHARRYRWVALRKGMTVAEYEGLAGLPPYSVYPEAKVVEMSALGYFMYRKATDEERAALDVHGSAGRARKHKPVAAGANMAARLERSRRYRELVRS